MFLNIKYDIYKIYYLLYNYEEISKKFSIVLLN